VTDPDRPDDAGAVLPDPAVHARSSGSGCVGTIPALLITHLVITIPDHRLDHDRLFRGTSAGASRTPRWSTAVRPGRATATSRCRWPSPASSWAASSPSSSRWNNFIFSVVLGGKSTRTLPSAIYNVLTFEQDSMGSARRRGLARHTCRCCLTVIAQRQIVAGLSAGG